MWVRKRDERGRGRYHVITDFYPLGLLCYCGTFLYIDSEPVQYEPLPPKSERCRRCEVVLA